jgi:hypothetical protein
MSWNPALTPSLALALSLGVFAAACSSSDDADSPSPTTTSSASATSTPPAAANCEALARYRTDISPTGNRVASGTGSLTSAEPRDVELPGTAQWVVPFAIDGSEVTWFVSLEGGDSVLVSPAGEVSESDVRLNGEPPEVRNGEAGPEVVSAYDDMALFPDAIPTSRVVFDGEFAVGLVAATDQYDHAILGDPFEAKAFEVLNRCTGERTRTTVASEDVIEGISAMLADIDGDGSKEVLVTISNDNVGSRMSAFTFEGDLVAESVPIGQGGRWQTQLAVAPIGPNGESEVVDIWKPHANGVAEFLQLEGNTLVRVADLAGFTNHVIRTQNLDKGLVADADTDGRLDVVVLTLENTEIAVLSRVEDQVETVALVALGSLATSNIAAAEQETGAISFAVGTEAGILRIWDGVRS